MAENTKISWTDHTLNLWWGCEKVASTCKNCYASVLAGRYHADQDLWRVGGNRRLVKGWKASLNKMQKAAQKAGEVHDVFLMSMGDLFEDDRTLIDHNGAVAGTTSGVRNEFFDLVLDGTHKNLRFLLLTQRPGNVPAMLPNRWKRNPPSNVAIGCSVGNQEELDKYLPLLLQVPSRKRFISIEPMLGPVELPPIFPVVVHAVAAMNQGLAGIDWVIAGGESGPKARPINPEWVHVLAADCALLGIPFHFKQWGTKQANPDPEDPTMDSKGGFSLGGIVHRKRLPR